MRYFLLILVTLGLFLTGSGQDPSKTSLESKTLRVGIKEFANDELTTRVNAIANDARYKALRQAAQARDLFPETSRAKGLIFPEGYKAVFFPVFDKAGWESGFLACNDESWTLSIVTENREAQVFQNFVARLDKSGRAVVENSATNKLDRFDAQPPSDNEIEAVSFNLTNFTTITAQTSCNYVKKLGISFGCFNPRSNPFGYYYTRIYRWGTTPDPRSPSWWACWRGSIHVCPRYESTGSPYTTVTCGFPPGHPAG